MSSTPTVADVRAAAAGPPSDADTAVAGAHAIQYPAGMYAELVGRPNAPGKVPTESSMPAAPSEPSPPDLPAEPEATLGVPVAHTREATPADQQPPGAEHPSDDPAIPVPVPTDNGHIADTAGNPGPDQPRTDATGSASDLVQATLPGDHGPGMSQTEQQRDAIMASGVEPDKGPAAALSKPAATLSSQKADEAAAAASQLKGFFHGTASVDLEALPMDTTTGTAAQQDSPSDPPKQGLPLYAEALHVPEDASSDELSAIPDGGVLVDPGLAVVGIAAGIPKPATAEATRALPDEILMADGFLGNGPPSPPMASSCAAAEVGSAAEPSGVDASQDLHASHEHQPVDKDDLAPSTQLGEGDRDPGQPPAGSKLEPEDSKVCSSPAEPTEPSMHADPAPCNLKDEADVAPSSTKGLDLSAAQPPQEGCRVLQASPPDAFGTADKDHPGQAAIIVTAGGDAAAAAAAAADDETAASADGSGVARAQPTIDSAVAGGALNGAAAANAAPGATSAPDDKPIAAAPGDSAPPPTAAKASPPPSVPALVPEKAVALMLASQPNSHGPSPSQVPGLQPLPPSGLLRRPKSAGEGPMRAGVTAKGSGPSLMGLLRTTGPPRASSPALGTPLAPLSSLWPQVGASELLVSERGPCTCW